MRRSFFRREADERHFRPQELSSQGVGKSDRTLREALAASSLLVAVLTCGKLLEIGYLMRRLCESLHISHTFSGNRCFLTLGVENVYVYVLIFILGQGLMESRLGSILPCS